jgi:hypothetical protein
MRGNKEASEVAANLFRIRKEPGSEFDPHTGYSDRLSLILLVPLGQGLANLLRARAQIGDDFG